MFGKHIFRSIKREPVQPIMIVMIVSLCVAVMILSIALPINIHKNASMSKQLDAWTSDLCITLRSNSKVRLIFKDEIDDALGDKARSVGEFPLTGFSRLDGENAEREQVFMGAFDLVEADRFFEPRYIEYGRITNNNLHKVAIIRESFAEEHKLKIGDTVDITVMGESFSFVIEAIAKDTGIFKQEHMLVDISSVRNVLDETSPLIASLPNDFDPFVKVHVKVNEGVDIKELKAELETLEIFVDKKVDVVADTSQKDYMTKILTLTIVIPASLFIVVALMMMISTFELLEKKRESDIALFRRVGAAPWHFKSIMYLESLIYSLMGAIFSLTVMILLKKLTPLKEVTVSVSGGIMHNVGQIVAASFLLETNVVVYYLPFLILSGTIAGIVIGAAAALLIKRVKIKK